MKIIILSISSDIGFALAKDWRDKQIDVIGTYRTYSKKCSLLEGMGVTLYKCDLKSNKSINEAAKKIITGGKWDCLILSAGTQEPIGKFSNVKFNDWEKSITINFINQSRFLHQLMNFRNNDNKNIPRVLFFAGGGTNNATQNYSAYTISKIASIKLCELLDAEYYDTVFTILGPGWVDTKIHNETISAGKNSGLNFQRTKEILRNNQFYPMDKVVECCNWLLNEDKAVVGGRNFSAVNDPWEEQGISKISSNKNIFKLRRYGNDYFK